MKKVLVAVDGSECAMRAARAAIEDARAAGAELHLVNVRPGVTGSAASFLDKASVDDYHRDEAMKELAGALAAAREAGMAAQHHIVVGPPGETIARFAEQIGADRVVVGSKGRSAIPDLVLGSAVRGLLETARMPVLVVK